MTDKKDVFILIYTFFFGMFFALLISLMYAPLMVSIPLGLGLSFIGAFILNKTIKKQFEKINIFDVAKRTGKIITQIFVPPNKVYVFLADKDIGEDAVKIKIYKKGRYETYKFNLSPNQQFQMEIPEQEIGMDNQLKPKQQIYVWDLINNPNVVFKLTEPSKQIFKIEPYNVEMVMFVYPTEILTREQLQLLDMVEQKKVKQIIKVPNEATGQLEEKTIEIPVYSPKPYALSTDNIREISAKHRFSTIATILEQTKAILGGAENLASSKISGFGFSLSNLLSNKKILAIIILAVGLIFALIIGNMIMHGFQTTMNPLAKQALEKMAKGGGIAGKTFP